MDLAKIRQKARNEQEKRQPEGAISLSLTEIPEPIPVHEDAASPSRTAVASQLPDVLSDADPHWLQTLQLESPDIPASRPRMRDPLEAILAGRAAAGCQVDVLPVLEEHSQTIVHEFQEYLCFRVSDEIYGINIMEIKEIIKPREVTEVPRAPSFVSGVISLRGIIIPIIDMLERLGLLRETVTGRELVIVVRHGESFSGLLVDEIIQVVHIKKDCFEAAPAVLEGINRDFVNGIGRADGRMIILLNLENIANIHLY